MKSAAKMTLAFCGGLVAAAVTTAVSAYGVPDEKLLDDPNSNGAPIRLAHRVAPPGERHAYPVASLLIDNPSLKIRD